MRPPSSTFRESPVKLDGQLASRIIQTSCLAGDRRSDLEGLYETSENAAERDSNCEPDTDRGQHDPAYKHRQGSGMKHGALH